jgi:hypothetical protein
MLSFFSGHPDPVTVRIVPPCIDPDGGFTLAIVKAMSMVAVTSALPFPFTQISGVKFMACVSLCEERIRRQSSDVVFDRSTAHLRRPICTVMVESKS